MAAVRAPAAPRDAPTPLVPTSAFGAAPGARSTPSRGTQGLAPGRLLFPRAASGLLGAGLAGGGRPLLSRGEGPLRAWPREEADAGKVPLTLSTQLTPAESSAHSLRVSTGTTT